MVGPTRLIKEEPGRIRTRLTFANVVSLIALFVALGGIAVAAVLITSNSQVGQGVMIQEAPATRSTFVVVDSELGLTTVTIRAGDGAVNFQEVSEPHTVSLNGIFFRCRASAQSGCP
jgi:hypothetical protein